jgi:hypothetical protein
MKTFVMVSVLILGLLAQGCNTTPKKTAYTTLAAVGSAVNATGDSLAQARLQGKVNDADWGTACQVWRDYLVVYNTSVQIAAYDFTSYAPADLVKIETLLIDTINQILTKGK